jgi:hypothetical protein
LDCVIASKNACKVLAQVLEMHTIALERKRNATNACANTSMKKANTAGQDTSEQKACANSIAAKSQEVKSCLCNKLQTKHEHHQQLQLVALQKAMDARRLMSNALNGKVQAEGQLHTKVNQRHCLEEELACAWQVHMEERTIHVQALDLLWQRIAELVCTVQEQESTITSQCEQADKATSHLEQLEQWLLLQSRALANTNHLAMKPRHRLKVAHVR